MFVRSLAWFRVGSSGRSHWRLCFCAWFSNQISYKKETWTISPSSAGMSLIPGQWEFGQWHPVWGRENREPFFTVQERFEKPVVWIERIAHWNLHDFCLTWLNTYIVLVRAPLALSSRDIRWGGGWGGWLSLSVEISVSWIPAKSLLNIG